MAPITEVVLITVVPNADYNSILKSAKIIAQQPGCVAVRTSRQNEDPSKALYFIDWDSVDSHMAFAYNTEVYGPFRQIVGTVMAGYVQPYHVSLSPYPPAALDHHNLDGAGKSKVAMVGQAWFPGGGDLTEQAKGKASETLEQVVKGLRAKLPQSFSGEVSSGWALEEDIWHKDEACRVFIFAIGWTGFEAYETFKNSEHFSEAFSAVRGLDGLMELEIWSVCTDNISA